MTGSVEYWDYVNLSLKGKSSFGPEGQLLSRHDLLYMNNYKYNVPPSVIRRWRSSERLDADTPVNLGPSGWLPKTVEAHGANRTRNELAGIHVKETPKL